MVRLLTYALAAGLCVYAWAWVIAWAVAYGRGQ